MGADLIKLNDFDRLVGIMKKYSKIQIVGAPGVGKSFVAQKLASATGIPVFHLDKIFWKKDWVSSSSEEFLSHLEEVLKASEFIIDGSYASSLTGALYALIW